MINSKWIKDLNVRQETIKLLEENIGRPLDDINQSKILYDPPPRVTEIQTKVNKCDVMRSKNVILSFYHMGDQLSHIYIGQSISSLTINNSLTIFKVFVYTKVRF